MPKEIIRTLGQLNSTGGDDLIVYAVPEGHSAVISSLVLTNTDITNPAIVTVYLRSRGITKAQGFNTTQSASKLIDSNAKFLSDVVVGDNVQNMSGGFTTVLTVDSDTQLTLNADIFTVVGADENYIVWPPAPSLNTREIIRRQIPLAAKATFPIKDGMTLSEFGQIYISSDIANVSTQCFGVETTASE